MTKHHDECLKVLQAATVVLPAFPEYKLMKEFIDDVGPSIYLAGAAMGMRLESNPDDFELEAGAFIAFRRRCSQKREGQLRAVARAELINLDTGTTLRVP